MSNETRLLIGVIATVGIMAAVAIVSMALG